jgi:hypothetical protein
VPPAGDIIMTSAARPASRAVVTLAAAIALALIASPSALAQFDSATVTAIASASTQFDDGSGLISEIVGGETANAYPGIIASSSLDPSSMIGSVHASCLIDAAMTPRTIIVSGSVNTDADNIEGELTTGVASAASELSVVFQIATPHRWRFTYGSVTGTHAGGSVSMLVAGTIQTVFSFDSIFMPFFDEQEGVIQPGTYEFTAGVSAFTDINDGFSGLFANASYSLELVLTPITSCAGDANDDGVVNFGDITSVLGNFGTDYTPGTGAGDADRNGAVNFADITSVLGNFGTDCRA